MLLHEPWNTSFAKLLFNRATTNNESVYAVDALYIARPTVDIFHYGRIDVGRLRARRRLDSLPTPPDRVRPNSAIDDRTD